MNKKIIAGSVIGLMGIVLFAGNTFAATISENGVGSFNKVVSKNKVVVSKKQTNSTTFSNGVNTMTYTGKNKANFNTVGTNSVMSGSATTDVTINNMAGSNTVDSSDVACCCDMVPGDNTITGNGVWSYNKIVDVNKCIVKTEQTNVTTIVNSVNTVTNTGGNSASFNTGSGSTVTSGDAETTVTITNVAGSNVAM